MACALCATLLVLGVGTEPALGIVGPSEDGAGGASHIVMVLNRRDATAGFCTGVVIAPDVVMTAAHCAPKGAELRVHFPQAGTAPVLLPIAGVARHPAYRAEAIKTRERSVDLALIQLATPLPDPFRPVTLDVASGTQIGARYRIAGYGVTREGEGASSGHLRSATLAARAPLSSLLLWADDPSRRGLGACTGDSGAPVMAEGRQEVAALVVWSAGDAGRQCGSLTQGLWIAPQRGWIDSVMQGWRHPPIP